MAVDPEEQRRARIEEHRVLERKLDRSAQRTKWVFLIGVLWCLWLAWHATTRWGHCYWLIPAGVDLYLFHKTWRYFR